MGKRDDGENMFDDLQDLYQQVILDHSKSPRNCRPMKDADQCAEGQNPMCGDQVKVYLKMEGDRIKDVSFEGSGCAISRASASLMTDAIKGLSRKQTEEMFEKFHDMITTGEARMEKGGKLGVFAGVHKFPARVKCAILSWHAAIAALQGKKDKVTTE